MLNHKNNVSLTVIIPCWNCALTIERAIKSVKNQSMLPQEIILVNDASTDNTLDILYQLSDKYGRDWIKIINLPKNSGPGIARNTGWDNSSCEYIAFLDADDAWYPEKTKIQLTWMIQNKDFSFSGSLSSLKKESSHKHDIFPAEELNVTPLNLIKMLVSNQIHARTVVLKRKINLRFKNKDYAEDYLLWLELLGNQYKGAKINFNLGYFYDLEFGSGYSGNLYNWEKKELLAIKYLKDHSMISSFQYIIFSTWSFIKYLKRVFTRIIIN